MGQIEEAMDLPTDHLQFPCQPALFGPDQPQMLQVIVVNLSFYGGIDVPALLRTPFLPLFLFVLLSISSDRSLLHEHHNVASGLSSESDMQAGGPQLATPFHNPGHAPVVLPSSAPKELPELRSPPPYLDGIPSAQSSLTIPASIRGPGNSASRPQPLGSSTESSSSEPTPTLSEASSDDRGIDQKAQGTSRTPSRVQSIWRPKDSLLSSLPPLPVSQLEGCDVFNLIDGIGIAFRCLDETVTAEEK